MPIGHAASDKMLHLTVSLPYGDAAGMQNFVDEVSNPKSPEYRHFITPEQVGQRFGVSAANVQKVADYLTSQGMKIRLVGKNRLSIMADATVAQAEAAFQTNIFQFAWKTLDVPEGGLFSFTTEPSIPASVGQAVIDVSGMENFTKPKPRTFLTPTQLRTLYNVAPLYGAGSQGQGRTVGISNWDGFKLSNIPHEYSQFGLPTPPGGVGSNVSVVTILSGMNGPNHGEADLDIQTVLAMAPLCNLIIYDGGNLSGSVDLTGTLTKEANDNNADIITESYGWQLGSSTANAVHNLHLSMSAQGITYMAASGDSGTDLSFFYPNIEPEVLSVGGTTAVATAAGVRTSETGWSGSGGGWNTNAAAFNVLPSYQKGTGVPTNINFRLNPDVALDADPNTGYVVYVDDGSNPAGFYQIGGTSGASPTFAGALADAEQRLIALGSLPANGAGKKRFGRIQDLIYSYNGDSSVFFDVISGGNGNLPNGQASTAKAGWDFVTGWGAMNFDGFVTKVANFAKITSVAASPSTVEGGSATTVTGTVTLSAAAATGGDVVNLSSSDPSVTVPASITIAAGATSGTFAITTSGVSTSKSVTLTASQSNSSATTTLTVTPAVPTALSVSPGSVIGGGSVVATGTVTIDVTAPAGGIAVALSSSDTTAATVPASVTVPQGAKTTTFTITHKAVTTATAVTITETIGTNNKTAVINVLPAKIGFFTLSPATVFGGNKVTASVTMSGPAPAGGISVPISLSDSTSATLSSPTITVAAGASTGSVTINTQAVDASKTVTVTVTYASVTKSAVLTINKPAMLSMTSNLTTALGGVTNPVITATLTSPAGPSGVVVNISTNLPSVAKFSTTTLSIPAGSKTATATLTTLAVASDTAVNAIGTFNGTKMVSVTVQAATLVSITLNPTTVLGNGINVVTGTLTINGPAGPNVRTVSLSSSDPSVVVPSAINIVPGAKTATFTFKPKAVATNTNVTITATLASISKTATLTVTH
ncbi:Peptidase S53 propeptide [Fimbriimonas ginsengisoli Gsoil 348]|uniref:Peptidase S53 propeptide n=2 Tax=Fimbriimonas ginsengisoli TaxID=1005039 RepID=A0A068NYB6_FIMGI|nr:Peptidase S53 propeptide [Fimbriimonas ginsengisoli Gsoil 348]